VKILYLPIKGIVQHRQFEKSTNIYPILLAMEATYYKNQGHEIYWDENINLSNTHRVIYEEEGLPFFSLPHADRILTKWWKYQDNGNFKYKPATYIQSARDCWWRKCSFCRWAKKYPRYECRNVRDVISEIKECANMNFKEIFDDSGTFPIGGWFKEFRHQLWWEDLDIKFSCNMRFGILNENDYYLMNMAGFRMLLYGLESANQRTLDRINKGIDINNAIKELKIASKYIEPHIAAMVGYPWETEEETLNTVNLVKDNLNSSLMIEGVLLTMADFRTNLAKEVIEEVKKCVLLCSNCHREIHFQQEKIKVVYPLAP
jgi:radical SAM superfamily enzyme YgiQ (UPF0313 family)